MASVDTAAQLRARRFPPLSDILLWLFGGILLLGLGWFLVTNLIDEPQRFAEVSLIGSGEGATALRLGDPVRVRVTGVDGERGRVDLELTGGGGKPPREGGKSPRKGRAGENG